jgi:hypothetical protein
MRAVYVAAAVLVAGLMSASVASAQVPAELAKARLERADALAKGDKAMFDKMTTDAFIVIDPAGKVETKTERGARVTPPANPPQGPPAAHLNETVAMYNTDTAIASWEQSIPGGSMRFTEVWVKDKGAWKCASAQIARPPAPAAAGGEGRGQGRRGGQ